MAIYAPGHCFVQHTFISPFLTITLPLHYNQFTRIY